MADKAMLLDPTRCTACRGCVVACKAWNDREAEETTNRGTYENPPGLSSKTWTTVKFKEMDGDNGIPRWLFTVYRCMHCTDAGCVKACPTGARVFGNLLDPKSEIRFVLKNKKVFRLKEDLGTDPKFWYFVD